MTRCSIFVLAPLASLALSAGAAAAATGDAPAAGAARQLAGHVRRSSHPGSAWKHHSGTSARRPIAPLLAPVVAANGRAIEEPDAAFYLGAVQVYPWSEGAVFRLYTAPGQISDIALEPGESLVSVAAGDTVRWIIGDTSSGAGSARRTHVLVKPVAAGLRTNLVIATDRRIYHVDAVSTERAAMAAISWSYPKDSLIAVGRSDGPPAEPPVAAAVAVEALNFDYRIDGARVSWRPLRVFDDGHQTFIEFPASIGEGEAPPLFVTGAEGKAELVNYRVRGHYYVVDRLFAAAELRLGGKHQQVVRIVRGAGRRVRRAA